MPQLMAFFACLIAMGALFSISYTIFNAFCSASAKLPTTWLTSPSLWAYSPFTLRPVKMSSLARGTPMVLASVCVPPPPGMRLQ